MDLPCGCCCEVDGLGAAVLTSEVCLFLDAFFPGSYFLLLIKKCAAAAKHLVRCLKAMPESFGWNGHGSIKLQQFSSVISSWVSLSFSNLSSVGADKCRGIFN